MSQMRQVRCVHASELTSIHVCSEMHQCTLRLVPISMYELTLCLEGLPVASNLCIGAAHAKRITCKMPSGKTFLETAGFLLRNPEIFLVYSVRLRFILQSVLACEKLATFRITLQNLHYVWLSKHQVIKIIIFHLNGQHWFTWIRHMAIIKH